MVAWLLSYVRFQPVSLPQEMKALWGTEQTADIRYATPERDEEKRGCVHIYTDLDEELAEAKAGQKVMPFKRGQK